MLAPAHTAPCQLPAGMLRVSEESLWAQCGACVQSKGVSSELADAVSDGGTMASAHGSMSKCLLDYNPMESEEYEEVVATWLASLLVLADHLAANPAASSANAEAEQEQQPFPPTPPSKQDLVA